MFKSSKVFKDIESSYIMTIRMRVNDKMVGDIICPNTNCSSEEMYRHVRDHLKSIDSQEVTITGILNEKYDDWYDDCGEEFYYDDNETFH